MYYLKLWLDKRKYIACTEKALIVVTEDEHGEPVRWAIFGNKGMAETEWKSTQEELVKLKELERA